MSPTIYSVEDPQQDQMWEVFDEMSKRFGALDGQTAKMEPAGGHGRGVMLLTEKELREEILALAWWMARPYSEWFDTESNFTFDDVSAKCQADLDAIDARHTSLLDEAEMHWDMCKWEDEIAQHKLLAEFTWDKRGEESAMNRRSEIGELVELTKIGQDYLTGTTPYGKVYIPKHVWDGTAFGEGGTITGFMLIRFLGFEDCRPERSMPWRAMKLWSACRRYP